MNVQITSEQGSETAAEKKKILIVDDDVSVRKSITSVLQGAGYEVFQSGDGQEALAQFDARGLDLVLLDLNMPNQSGWDTFEGFTGKNPTLPVIIITGERRQSQRARSAGAGALMEKPLDVTQLLQTMQELLTEPEEARLRRMCGHPRDGRYVSRYFPRRK